MCNVSKDIVICVAEIPFREWIQFGSDASAIITTTDLISPRNFKSLRRVTSILACV